MVRAGLNAQALAEDFVQKVRMNNVSGLPALSAPVLNFSTAPIDDVIHGQDRNAVAMWIVTELARHAAVQL